jgi:glycosyltransferase involved in cell wall biosynthesis
MMKSNNEKVAVIMSVYHSDSLEYLKDAVNSILTQSLNKLTFLIYRDGIVPISIDEYLSFIESKYENIKVFSSEKNAGLANALNKLIDYIVLDGTYNYIARMDSDDISRKERLEKQVLFFKKNQNISVLGTSCHEFGASFALDEKHLPKSPAPLLDFSITHCPFIHPSVMFRTTVFISGIRYPTDTSLTEDMALWFILLGKGFQFANLNEVLLDYRLNENTLERRKGVSKALSEFTIRFNNMISLKKVSIRNVMLITARLLFHILPSYLMKIAYRKAR